MELKKNPKADLEKWKGFFFEIGLVVILGICLVAFSWETPTKDNNANRQENVDNQEAQEEEMLDTEDQEEEQKPEEEIPEEQPEPEINMDELEVKEDEEQLTHEATTQNFDEATNTTQIADVKMDEEEEVDEPIIRVPDKDPEFPGGMEALYKYLGENIKYPKVAQENGISGKVYVTFVVEKDGRITDVKVLRDIGGGCGAEAVRVVKSMPKWTPGRMGARACRVQFNLPVAFNFKN